jgi:hypothetical protein
MVVAAVGLLLGLNTWGGEAVSRTPEAYIAIGVGLFAAGALLRRWVAAAFGLVLLAGLAWELIVVNPTRPENMQFVKEWFGVVDLQTFKPIAGARVRVVSRATSIGTTGADGGVELKVYKPQIDAEVGPFDYDVDWFVEVDAPGYPSVRTGYRALRALRTVETGPTGRFCIGMRRTAAKP